jgi:hypothetical protein
MEADLDSGKRMSLREGDFEDWKNKKFTELAELFAEIEDNKFDEFCWGRFESERQGMNDDQYDRDRDDKMLQEKNGN